MSGLILYSRSGCHLCEQAEAALAGLGLEYTRVEIAGDPELEARYGWDVPVLMQDDQLLAKGVLSPARLVRLGLKRS